MKQKLDIETWVRKEHFNLFNEFEEPFYGVCINIDCTAAYRFVKENKVSFFLYYLHKALAAANTIEPFRYRIEENEVFIYDQINAGSTVGRSNGTFGFGYFYYHPSFTEFLAAAITEVNDVQSRNDLVRSPKNDVIRCSALPWLDFTSISHARSFSFKDSCPKISFGKMTECNEKKTMPVSVHVHHALVDGLHVGQYIDCFQKLMNEAG